MNWRILLSEYPESLLKDPFPLALLVLIERAGMATEGELQRQSGADPSRLVATLLMLHNNKLVEYARDHVAVSDRGRQFVDRFDLRNTIFEELLQGIPLQDRQRESLLQSLSEYRSRSFERYRESTRAANRWAALCLSVPFQRDMPPEVGRLGLLAIWLHDISLAGGRVDPLESTDAGTSGKRDKRASEDLWTKAIGWIRTKDAAAVAPQPMSYLATHSNFAHQLWCLHTESRHNVDARLWDYEWSSAGKWSQVLHGCHSAEEAVGRGEVFWGPLRFHHLADRHGRLQGRAGVSADLLQQGIGELFIQLFSATDLDDLSKRTRMPVPVLRRLLESARQKCTDLLAEAAAERVDRSDSPS